MFEVKNIHIHTAYTHRALFFLHITLQGAVFVLRPNFEQSAVSGPKLTVTYLKGQKV